ncbi:MAG: ICEBs1 excisionase [Lachnospiraceae bacterium]|nr:ICEBs1 excisionase [Lachnospiraceae bacterium]
MRENEKIYITAKELSELLGISIGHAYKIIHQMNEELTKAGYLVISGKVPVRYFEKRWYGLEGVNT